jgi:hypothetical protein
MPRLADDTRKLLDHIVRTCLLRDDLVSIDLDASANEPGDAIESDKKNAVRRELERADELAGAFGHAIARSHSGVIVLDDRDPDENQMADALIHVLVRSDLATSRATEIEPNHYRYQITIDWPKLEAVATEAGVDLDQLVRKAS